MRWPQDGLRLNLAQDLSLCHKNGALVFCGLHDESLEQFLSCHFFYQGLNPLLRQKPLYPNASAVTPSTHTPL